MLVITGADGFIGSNLVKALNDKGRHDIIAVDATQAPRYVHAMKVERLEPFQIVPSLLRQFGRKNIEAVFHLGAITDTMATDRALVMRQNFEYTRMLWEICAEFGCPLIYASSASTYGDGSLGFDDGHDPRRFKPLNIYAESKQLFDIWALEQEEQPPRWVGLKFFNVYGPREEHKGKMASMVYHGFNQIVKDGRIRLFESDDAAVPHGGQRRDFIYVDDIIAALMYFFETPVSKTAKNGLYNVGTGQARTFNDLATAVFHAVGRQPHIDYFPMPPHLKKQYQAFTQATTSKLRGAGFSQPFTSLEEGVKRYVQSYLLGRRN